MACERIAGTGRGKRSSLTLETLLRWRLDLAETNIDISDMPLDLAAAYYEALAQKAEDQAKEYEKQMKK